MISLPFPTTYPPYIFSTTTHNVSSSATQISTPQTLPLHNPPIKNLLNPQLLGWLGEKLGSSKKIAKADLLQSVPLLYTCLEDRSADVRKAATEATLGYMIHCGFESMAGKVSVVKVGGEGKGAMGKEFGGFFGVWVLFGVFLGVCWCKPLQGFPQPTLRPPLSSTISPPLKITS